MALLPTALFLALRRARARERQLGTVGGEGYAPKGRLRWDSSRRER